MRGLTLIEVLASVALLAIMAAATLPWITDARRLSVRRHLEIEPVALGDIADAVLADPDAFALPPLLDIDSGPVAAMSEDGTVFTIRRAEQSKDEQRYAWLVFEAGELMTARIIRLPQEPTP